MFSRLPLQRKVTWVLALACLLALALATVSLGVFQWLDQHQRALAQYQALVEMLSVPLVPTLAFDDGDRAAACLETLRRMPDVVAAHVYTANGSLFASYTRTGAAPLPAERPMTDGIHASGGQLRIVRTLTDNRVEGRIELVSDLTTQRAMLGQSLLILVGVAGFLLLLSLPLSSVLHRSITRPLTLLSETSRQITEHHDYSVRAPVEGEDETAQMARSFNQMVQAIQRNAAALRDREEFLRGIIDNSPAALCVKNADGCYVNVNQAFADLIGRAPQDILGHTDNDLFHRPVADAIRQADLQTFAEATVHAGEEVAPSPAGPRTCWVVRFPLRDDNRRVSAVAAIATDITALKNAEQAIRDANQELERRVHERTAELQTRVEEVERLNRNMISLLADLQSARARADSSNLQLQAANRELEAFSYSVSHDLRAPLRNVAGFVDLLRKSASGQLPAAALRHLETIQRETSRMGNLIEELLNFSRLGRARLRLQAIPLDELVQSVREDLHAEIQDRRVVWNIGPLPVVNADRTLLRLVLENLLGNAVKYTRPRPETRIDISATLDPDRAEHVICVRDNGVGFNMKYASRLFAVFQRLHSARDFEGTGIGLANVQRIISRHSGRVWAEAEEGAGAAFYFTLPVQPSLA